MVKSRDPDFFKTWIFIIIKIRFYRVQYPTLTKIHLFKFQLHRINVAPTLSVWDILFAVEMDSWIPFSFFSKMGVKMNLRIITRNYAGDPEKRVFDKIVRKLKNWHFWQKKKSHFEPTQVSKDQEQGPRNEFHAWRLKVLLILLKSKKPEISFWRFIRISNKFEILNCSTQVSGQLFLNLRELTSSSKLK